LQDTVRKRLEEKWIGPKSRPSQAALFDSSEKPPPASHYDQIYDLLAVRVITDTIRNCYAPWASSTRSGARFPAGSRITIAMPGQPVPVAPYDGHHSGQTFEVQIRTNECIACAEQGVAAHWRYKDGKNVSDADDQRILLDEAINRMGKEMQEPSEFMSTLKVDLYPEEVYAFPPESGSARAPARRHAR